MTAAASQLSREDKVRTVAAMREFGGDFVRRLALAWLSADDVNSARIEAAFPRIHQPLSGHGVGQGAGMSVGRERTEDGLPPPPRATMGVRSKPLPSVGSSPCLTDLEKELVEHLYAIASYADAPHVAPEKALTFICQTARAGIAKARQS